MAMYVKVRRMNYRDGLSVSEIVQRTSLLRSAMKSWLREPLRSEMAYRRDVRPKNLDGFLEWQRQSLGNFARRPRKERRTVLRLFAQLQAEGFTGSYCRAMQAIRVLRAEAGAVTARSAYVPLRFE